MFDNSVNNFHGQLERAKAESPLAFLIFRYSRYNEILIPKDCPIRAIAQPSTGKYTPIDSSTRDPQGAIKGLPGKRPAPRTL